MVSAAERELKAETAEPAEDLEALDTTMPEDMEEEAGENDPETEG